MRNLKEAKAEAAGEESNVDGDDQLSEIWHQSDSETKGEAIKILMRMAYNHIISQIKWDDILVNEDNSIEEQD